MLALLSHGWKPRIFQHVIEWSIWKLQSIDLWNISMAFTGADPGTFGWGGPNVGSEWLLNLFWPAEKAETTTCFSICEQLSRLVQEILLCEQRQTDHEDTQKQLHFWIALGFSFVGKCNLRFIKKISQLESDIWSCQCKSFSFKQASDLIGGSGPSPWIRQSVLFTLLPSRMCVM